MFLVTGLVVIAIAIWLYRGMGVPADALRLHGRVDDLERKRFGSRSTRPMTGAFIEYDHPVTGRRERLEPTS